MIGKESYIFLVLSVIIVLLTTIDIVKDLQEGLPLKHISHEVGIVSLCLILICYQVKLIWSKNSQIKAVELKIDEASQENEAIRRQLRKLSGDFQQLIQLQMEQWKFSESEKDIGKLIMKGMNMKEIAHIRETSESTVRQQATSIYRKANVHGRQEFIAYFLEDL